MDWEVRRGDDVWGPYEEAEVETFLAERRLDAATLVRPVGKRTWKSAARHAPFANALRRAGWSQDDLPGAPAASPGSEQNPDPTGNPFKNPARWDQLTHVNLPAEAARLPETIEVQYEGVHRGPTRAEPILERSTARSPISIWLGQRWWLSGAVVLAVVVFVGVLREAPRLSSWLHTAPTTSAPLPLPVPTPRAAQLPPPFDAIHLGMPVEELHRAFPPSGDVASCQTQLIGGEVARPRIPGDAEAAPYSSCPDLVAVASLSPYELKQLATLAVEADDANAEDVLRGLVAAVAQVQVALRAGVLSEEEVRDAALARVDTGRGAGLNLGGQLYDGGQRFLAPRNARRPLGATLGSGCIEFDRDRVRSYVAGDYSLGQLDGDARSRFAGCSGAFVQRERAIKLEFLARVGGLAGIGLARASRFDRKLDSEEPSTFAVFEARSQLPRRAARLGVKIANALPDLERWLDGAVHIRGVDAEEAVFRSALVWSTNGRVSRVIVTLGGAHTIGAAVSSLEELFGPGKKDRAITTWALEGGGVGRLDRGAAWGYFVEAADATPPRGSAPPSTPVPTSPSTAVALESLPEATPFPSAPRPSPAPTAPTTGDPVAKPGPGLD